MTEYLDADGVEGLAAKYVWDLRKDAKKQRREASSSDNYALNEGIEAGIRKTEEVLEDFVEFVRQEVG